MRTRRPWVGIGPAALAVVVTVALGAVLAREKRRASLRAEQADREMAAGDTVRCVSD